MGARARSIVAGAVHPRFDAIGQEFVQLNHRLTAAENLLARNEAEVAALRQQVDECLDFLRIQHAIVRDAFEVARPLLGSNDRQQ